MKTRRLLIPGLLITALAAGCSSDTDVPAANPTDPTGSTPPATEPAPPTEPAPIVGDAAVWRVADGEDIGAASRSFTALVTRLDCANGVTGEVYAPTVEASDDGLVVTFSLVPNDPEGSYTCPANDEVPYEVDLGERVGNRAIIDGACLDDGRAATTSFCTPGSERWTP